MCVLVVGLFNVISCVTGIHKRRSPSRIHEILKNYFLMLARRCCGSFTHILCEHHCCKTLRSTRFVYTTIQHHDHSYNISQLQAIQKSQGIGTPGSPQSQPPGLASPQLHAATVSNTNTGFSYNMPSAMGSGGPYSGAMHPQSHAAMHHSVMRHSSPGPQHHQAQQQALNAHGNYGGSY